MAFLLSPEDMKDLLVIRRQREQALADFEAFFARVDAKLSTDAANLTDTDINRLVHEFR